MTKASTVLTDALTNLRENGVNRDGWYVNRTDRPGQCFCSVGALRMASGGRVEIENYIDTRFDHETEDDVDVEVTDYDIVLDNYVLASEAERYLERALEELGIRTDGPGHSSYYAISGKWPNVPTFNDNSRTDAEVFAVFEKAISLAVEDEAA